MLPDPIVPLAEAALIDEHCVALGQDLSGLMETAGYAVSTEVSRRAPAGPVLIACGGGNNGGDGYVAARLLSAAGREVWLWPVQPPRSRLCIEQARRLPAAVRRVTAPPTERPALLVDAILGAGAHGPLREEVANALRLLAASATPCLAVDVPTGLGTDLVLPQTFTLTLAVAKQELVAAGPGLPWRVADIGIDPRAITQVHRTCLRRFPRHRRDGHKGQHGEVLVIGGGPFPGALNYACRAALATGCDLVQAWTAGMVDLPPSILRQVQHGDHLVPADTEILSSRLARAGAVLIGPGCGRNQTVDEALRQAYSLAVELAVPMVVDADGLTALGREIRGHGPSDPPLVITPHAGELRALFDGDCDDETIHRFARRNRVVLAKRQEDLITDGARWQRNHAGNPRMAVGGTGDCLAGLTAGLLARACTAFDAARMAVHWLCAAADRCWDTSGPCYTPDDILAELPRYLREALTALGCWPPVTEGP